MVSSMSSRGAVIGVFALVAIAIVLASSFADATATFESHYGYSRTWNAAVRLVRVDNGWKITEKDDSSGYLLFEYRSPESNKSSPGSFELARGGDGDDAVRVVVRLAQMPRYHEQLLLDALGAKMRREYGAPPPSHPALPVTDGGVDAED